MASEHIKLRVERWVWILVYGGLFILSLGIFVLRERDEVLGWPLVGGGLVLALAGAVLVWVRSRMKETP